MGEVRQRVVAIVHQNLARGEERISVSYSDYLEYREQASTLYWWGDFEALEALYNRVARPGQWVADQGSAVAAYWITVSVLVSGTPRVNAREPPCADNGVGQFLTGGGESGVQFAQGVAIERIQLVGAVQCHPGNAVVEIDEHGLEEIFGRNEGLSDERGQRSTIELIDDRHHRRIHGTVLCHLGLTRRRTGRVQHDLTHACADRVQMRWPDADGQRVELCREQRGELRRHLHARPPDARQPAPAR